jgi:hypothetical protein
MFFFLSFFKSVETILPDMKMFLVMLRYSVSFNLNFFVGGGLYSGKGQVLFFCLYFTLPIVFCLQV